MWLREGIHISNLQFFIDHITEANQICMFSYSGTEVEDLILILFTFISEVSHDQTYFFM